MNFSDRIKILKTADLKSAEDGALKNLKNIRADSFSDYLKKVKNPYLFKVNNIKVKITFSGGEDAEKILEKIAIKKAL